MKDYIGDFLKDKNLEHVFDIVMTGVGLFGKATKIKRACRIAKVNKSEVICVGDEDRDILAAKKAGIEIISVTWGFHSKGLLEKHNPDFIANKPEEILKIIRDASA